MNIQCGFHWSPTSGVLHLLLLPPSLIRETLLEATKHTGPPASFYLLAFSNVSFCHRSGPCALRVSGRVDSWYAGVTSPMWGRNGRECLVWQTAALSMSTKVSGVLLSSTFCCQLKPFLILGWWLCNLSDPIVCVCGQRDMDPLIHSTSYSVKRVNESGLMFGCQPCRCDC